MVFHCLIYFDATSARFMFLPSTNDRRLRAKACALLLTATLELACGADDLTIRQRTLTLPVNSTCLVTNVSQFRTLAPEAYLAECDFILTGVVTLVDTNRELMVLQDQTGAVALHFPLEDRGLQVGQLVTLDGSNCCPFFSSFPDYPYHPSHGDISGSFETPMNWGDYNLTRMRGYLHPLVTGDYRFWIASDDSSELWLSTDSDPTNARKIAAVPHYHWTDRHQWSKYPSQRSELIKLKAGEVYYIEALQDQTVADEHLTVAWQEPGQVQPSIAVIAGRYLTPWNEACHSIETATNGILREYWTNYFAGNVEGLTGSRPFESTLSVNQVSVQNHGPGDLPKPERITLNQRMRTESNYRWVMLEGLVRFLANEGDTTSLDVFDGKAEIKVDILHWSQGRSGLSKQSTNFAVRVEGVCEGVKDQNGTMTPGRIWASEERRVSLIEPGMINDFTLTNTPSQGNSGASTLAKQSYYEIHGVITFNDRLLGNDYIFIQEADSALLVFVENSSLRARLKVGQRFDLGGTPDRGKAIPSISPIFVTEEGWQGMPAPIRHPFDTAMQTNFEGRWCELVGVVHAVNTNGTLSLVGEDGHATLWVGQTASNYLASCVDAKLGVRGVLTQCIMNSPLLLIPSTGFVEIEEAPPKDPFAIPRSLVAGLVWEGKKASLSHRVRITGEVTYRDARAIFVQDEGGGIRLQTSDQPLVEVGEAVEVLGFPMMSGSGHVLTEALVRRTELVKRANPTDLDLKQAVPTKQIGSLVRARATLIGRRTNDMSQVLDFQEQRCIFSAALANDRGTIKDIPIGSQLWVTGVCDDEVTPGAIDGDSSPKLQVTTSLKILLREPGDVVVISRPPWWTWQKAVMLVGSLLTGLAITLLWTYLLHRRLEHQQAIQLAFSRLVLGRLEDERHKIAVNLHDSLGHTLLVIKNHATLASQSNFKEQEVSSRMSQISGATTQAIEEVRRIAQGLRPSQLDRLGLTEAIRALVNRATEDNAIQFACRVDNVDGVFENDAEIHVYRIVQEAVTNVVKHSGAAEATVVIKKTEAAVVLSIRDNGHGFDPSNTSPRVRDSGYGLAGIAERVRILKGAMVLDSHPGAGTSLTVKLQLKS